MIEEPENEEINLANKMKEKYCDKTGKETDPKEAAKIIHEIGKIYRKQSPDKLSLIKSVGLFNAAIVRNPSNVSDIRNDLFMACQHILAISGAKVQNADLINKSTEVKQSFNELRDEVDQILYTLDKSANKSKISSIQAINQTIALKYKAIMADLGQFCENVMGKPPCVYAIAGMGSLARTETTPYSDFEHIILLFDDKNYKSFVEYFRWYSVIFHSIVLNVQESIIPSLNIRTLNDKNFSLGNWYFDAFTPRGISFDGMMPHASKFPLGRIQHTKTKPFETELIKPVSEMLEYLSSDADLKNGYRLADILTKSCFVFGNRDVYKQFENGVIMHLNQTPKPKLIEEMKQRVKNDLNNYSTRFRLAKLKSDDKINIKQLIYRSTTIFIAALGRINNISANSSFGIVNEMERAGIITRNTRDELCYAIAIACEIRLKVYSKSKSQNDSPIDLKRDVETQFLDIVGVANTVKCLQIAYCLQCEVARQLNFTKLHFYSDPQLFNFKIGLVFEIKTLIASFPKNQLKYFRDKNEFAFDECIKQLEITSPVEYGSNTINNAEKIEFMIELAKHLSSEKIFDEALEFYQDTLQINKNISVDEQKDYKIVVGLNDVGNCLIEANHYDEGLNLLKEALERSQNLPSDQQNYTNPAILNNIGFCLMKMQQYVNAISHFKQTLAIYQNMPCNELVLRKMKITLNNLGTCYMHIEKYDQAIAHLQKALEIVKKISFDERKDRDVAVVLNNIGNCLRKVDQYDYALPYLKEALTINRNTSLNERKDRSIAAILSNTGGCLTKMQQYDNALIHLNEALEIHQNISLNEREDGNIATTLDLMGDCFREMQQYDDALSVLKQALEIERKISLHALKDGNIAKTLHSTGLCYFEKQQYNDALNYLKESLEILRNISVDKQKDAAVVTTLKDIGNCLMKMQRYAEATIYLIEAHEIQLRILLDEQKYREIAITLDEISNCLRKM